MRTDGTRSFIYRIFFKDDPANQPVAVGGYDSPTLMDLQTYAPATAQDSATVLPYDPPPVNAAEPVYYPQSANATEPVFGPSAVRASEPVFGPQPTQAPAAVAPTVFCIQCGHPNRRDSSKFCIKCGSKLKVVRM